MTTIAPPPVPPTNPPPALTAGGRTAIRSFLVIAAALVIVGSAVALGVTAWGLSTFRVVADEKPLPGDIRSLVIDARDVPAAIRLTTDGDATEPRVSMRLVNSARAGDQTLDVRRTGGDTVVTVSGARPEFLDWGRAGEITVTLPPDVARRLSVTTRQDTGVLFADADVDVLTASNEDGAVMLSGSARRIDVRTTDADVVAREPLSVRESFVVDAVDGDVTADFTGAPPRTVAVTTETGDVALRLPEPGPYLIRASGESTRVRVPETDDAGRAAAEVTVRSVDGDTTIDHLGSDRMERPHR
ncbi:DUF4097 family beta strand repeat-containing protein [Mycolicibacterium sediminis]|uniref:DUF4097 domain-containing protein n=1 Tax=Mycolicibacterium sediminis TaxID=1286180 RepID=A0A7I7QZ00_9MYCO|nr:DUF4097 family beta strand repeat-containing protein [Mycolicibacterium sediminis]BBY31136.1 hypothetical protein MSEDJ_52320 [Mycolicibacterium sediminis]